jgi:anaerobic ribonucleoside-triphosphate reductase activating protein
MRISGIVEDSITDGEGMRFAVFLQGCPHRCEDCHNPHTHDPDGGYDTSIDELFDRIERNPLCSGLTLSGGEPFLQAAGCAELAERVKELGLNVWCWSGWTLEELTGANAPPNAAELLQYCDVLVDGRFEIAQKNLNLKWRGSANQRVWRKSTGSVNSNTADVDNHNNEHTAEIWRIDE